MILDASIIRAIVSKFSIWLGRALADEAYDRMHGGKADDEENRSALRTLQLGIAEGPKR